MTPNKMIFSQFLRVVNAHSTTGKVMFYRRLSVCPPGSTPVSGPKSGSRSLPGGTSASGSRSFQGWSFPKYCYRFCQGWGFPNQDRTESTILDRTGDSPLTGQGGTTPNRTGVPPLPGRDSWNHRTGVPPLPQNRG